MNHNVIVYTFRTSPIIEELRAVFGEIHILGQLKSDIAKLERVILQEKPTHILGIGNAAETRFEPVAINRLHGTKKIVRDGPEAYSLFVPNADLPNATHPTDSFCNWSAYHLAHLVAGHCLNSQIIFIHISPANKEILLSMNLSRMF